MVGPMAKPDSEDDALLEVLSQAETISRAAIEAKAHIMTLQRKLSKAGVRVNIEPLMAKAQVVRYGADHWSFGYQSNSQEGWFIAYDQERVIHLSDAPDAVLIAAIEKLPLVLQYIRTAQAKILTEFVPTKMSNLS
jgi:hypothetical protein